MGGYKFFYLDWDLILYKCASLKENYGSLLELGNREFTYSECDLCHWQCFKDPRIYYYPLIQMEQIAVNLKRGRFGQVLGVLDRRNLESLSAWADLAVNRFYA